MLNADALIDYTQGRLGTAEAEAALTRALAEVRRWCGWHVTPELDADIVVDGPGGPLLRLPTLCLVELTSATEDGTAITPAALEWSRIGLVRKQSGGLWTSRLGGIAVTMTHGFDTAPDFDAAVLSVADRRALAAGGALSSVGPFQFGQSAEPFGSSRTNASPFTSGEKSILEQYRLEPSP